jgi:superfamily II RNA helicase
VVAETAPWEAVPTTTAPLFARLPGTDDPDEILDAFLGHVADANLSLYPAQEEAIVELLAGNHVILDTPTGSGKSLVALAAHVAALARGQRSFYTAPIKALVSEKFFALCRDLGSDQVGMLTGDASVNPGAPVICCTAEILANLALRDGAAAPVDVVIMDEFHFYADRDRGWAWQVPLIELTRVQFLLMSATLGPTRRFQEDLERRTGRPCTLVKRTERPVPLEYEYRQTPLHESLAELMTRGLAPVYLVHFTQNAAVDAAQALTSVDLCSKEEKAAIKEAIGRFRFDSPFGNDLRRYLHHGIGVHHAGLLPKYRLLVEKLAQEGRLKVICGTDTLGVGINVPIRTVLFTQLCKYDGATTRVLQVREFKQIAGRAGRKGYDDRGWVWCQAPEHVVENLRAEAAALTDAKKRKKLVKRKPPEFGYAHWSADTFRRLAEGEPEQLKSSFHVTHAMLLELLDRPGDGCGAMRHLLTETHEPRKEFRRHVRRAIAIYRSLVSQHILEVLGSPDDQGRLVRVDLDLQEDFRLNQPLSPWVIDAVGRLDAASPEYAADVLTVVESVLENPGPVLARQVDRAKSEALAAMKRAGIEYEERMERLAEITHPKPCEEFVYGTFDAWRGRHPWVEDNVRPKSVARELFERGMTVKEYIADYGLKRSEGVLLRYLSDAYKTVVQTVPIAASTDDVEDLIDWLGATVRAVDSSLIDEWERLKNPEDEVQEERASDEAFDITANRRAFRVMVRNLVFSWVQWLARKEYDRFGSVEPADRDDRWTPERIREAMASYWDEFGEVRADAEARGTAWFAVEEGREAWDVRQVLVDPEGYGEWSIEARVDLARSREEGRAVVLLARVGRTAAG